jgi:hypothetical protein
MTKSIAIGEQVVGAAAGTAFWEYTTPGSHDLPIVLSPEEVTRLINSARNLLGN